MSKSIRLNLAPMLELRKKLAEVGKRRAQVGIFSNRDARTPVSMWHTETSNATVGAVHEFGQVAWSETAHAEIKTPQRSFLRMPLMLNLGAMLEKYAGAIGYLIRFGTPRKVLGLVGHVAQGEVDHAFNTHGYGQWPPLSPTTVALKTANHGIPLIESGQLRDSISSRVV
ncbi:MAG: hypothetical protein KGJ86_00645 [Chloroflexota bacterium]|nr:hypothetical protein [Chloroflexota bacterium]